METKEYHVVPGDTLGNISLKLYGHAYWQRLYAMNREVIHREQERRDPSKSGPNWIYPGTVLQVPDEPHAIQPPQG